MAFWSKFIGGGVKEAGEGIKAAGEGVSTALGSVGGVFNDMRTAVTGVDAKSKARIEELIAQAEAKVAEATARAAEAFQNIMGQLNLADARSGSWFNSGWRPALGWVCVLAMALYYPTRIITGMTIWVIQSIEAMRTFIPTSDMPWVVLPPMPEVGMSDIIGLVITLLGGSWLRSQDKNNKVA